jgi:HTH-type transcriptional regulator / antitoxin HipB
MNDFPIQTPQQLSSHLRSLRKRLHLSQGQLGVRLGVEQARVGKIERNPGAVSVAQLIELLATLDAELFIRPKGTRARLVAAKKVAW